MTELLPHTASAPASSGLRETLYWRCWGDCRGVRDLVIGSGLEFEERGTHELKGVPGEWRLFAVASP
jgi:hypothetical protein